MNDDRVRLRIEAIEYSITQLQQGDIREMEAEALYRDGKDLIADVQMVLATGSGDVEFID